MRIKKDLSKYSYNQLTAMYNFCYNYFHNQHCFSCNCNGCPFDGLCDEIEDLMGDVAEEMEKRD